MRVLAIHAHPDDIEFSIAGTLFLLKRMGCEIHYMNIANGSCGTVEHTKEEIVRIRRDESLAACELLGAVYHESICDDLCIFYCDEVLRKTAAVIREVDPEIVLTAPPHDYMEDHMNACRLVLGGVFARGMPNYVTDPPLAPVDTEVVVYHAMPHGLQDGLRNPVSPDFYVNVESVIERKTAMLACHGSQKEWLDRTQGFDSYLNTMKETDARLAAQAGGIAFAEGFRRHLHFGYSRTEKDPLPRLLGDFVFFRESEPKR